jgi:PHP family Zn ribbon phosphoesterase
VIEVYDKFIKKHTEIKIMQETSFEELKKINKTIAKYIIAFRKDFVVFKPGGAGQYAVPVICFSEKEKKEKQKKINENLYLKDTQTKLF